MFGFAWFAHQTPSVLPRAVSKGVPSKWQQFDSMLDRLETPVANVHRDGACTNPEHTAKIEAGQTSQIPMF